LFYILTEALAADSGMGNGCLYWLSDDQKAARAPQALVLLEALTAAEKRRSLKFWTGDESWMMWVDRATESSIRVDEELTH
jgi:hypothetical protein